MKFISLIKRMEFKHNKTLFSFISSYYFNALEKNHNYILNVGKIMIHLKILSKIVLISERKQGIKIRFG